MVDEPSEVDDELLAHKDAVLDYINQINALKTTPSRQGVVTRLLRDCSVFIADVDEHDVPKRADLVDFQARRASIEIQFYNLKNTAGG